MMTKFARILLQDGDFGHIIRQVTAGATPLYLVATAYGSTLIVAANNFIVTGWSGTNRRGSPRRRVERRTLQVPLAANMHERRVAGRRQGERRQFAVTQT